MAWLKVISYRAMSDRPSERIKTLIAIALTFASGAMDVTSFTRLGDVFTSVMTGNIVLLGLAVALRSLTLASHTAVSIAGYIAGVAAGSRVAYRFKAARTAKAAPGDDDGRASGVPAYAGWALLAEVILLAGFTVGWEISGGRPAGWAQFCLLAVAAAAMGVQSSTVRYMGLSEVSTTYLTGTLTGLVSSLVNPDQDMPHGLRRFGVLIGLAAGAGLSGLLVAVGAAAGVPALPLAAVVTALVLAAAPRGWRWPGGREASGRGS